MSGAPRLAAVDIARTAALGGMVVYHLVYDLALLGHIPRDVALTGPMRGLAILVAGSFLFLAGVSLHLAHPTHIRWRAFWRRFAVIAAAAALVSVATWAVFPDAFVFFGILHSIAAASLAGAVLHRLPAVALLALAALVFALPRVLTIPAFDHPLLWWTGLSPSHPPSVDFEPFFPWAAPFLAGLALARLLRLERMARPVGPWGRRLGWPGRHSLVIYLVHQPILLGLLIAAGTLGLIPRA